MADAEFKKYNKRKYVEIIEAKNKKESRHAIGYLEIWIFPKTGFTQSRLYFSRQLLFID